MKDTNDKQTFDFLDKPRPGRPYTGKAKTQAQIQREYRQRKKARESELSRPLVHALTGEVLKGPEFAYCLTVPEISCARHALELAYLVRGVGWTDAGAYQLYCKLSARAESQPPH